jgi:hypothetical protein
MSVRLSTAFLAGNTELKKLVQRAYTGLTHPVKIVWGSSAAAAPAALSLAALPKLAVSSATERKEKSTVLSINSSFCWSRTCCVLGEGSASTPSKPCDQRAVVGMHVGHRRQLQLRQLGLQRRGARGARGGVVQRHEGRHGVSGVDEQVRQRG